MSDSHTRARRALASAGIAEDAPLERAQSNANETWLGDGFVLRVNHRGDIGRLRREAELAMLLPKEALHPGVLDHGCGDEIEWLLLRRVPGIDLSRAWPELDDRRRERAARELAAALRAFHQVDGPNLPKGDDLDPPHILPLNRLLGVMTKIAAEGPIDAQLMAESEAFVRQRWDAFDSAGMGLVHGDLHLENMLWDGEHISALLDLDWTRRSWIEVDLETVLSFCDHPALFVAADYEERALTRDYAGVPAWLEAEYPDWFAHPRLDDRLAVLHVSRTIGLIHESPPARSLDPNDLRDRRNHLRAALAGQPRMARSFSFANS